ncbi:MAG TPA: acetylornithine/succinylornithine family transaminase [Thermoanaerobaculia bacterium]|nr:acetylornithine/succinylornithine family transaminase [Thermoanaerobaculia bacterium]
MLLHDESPGAVESREHSSILGTYGRTAFHPRSGSGARLFDAAGKAYWDLLAGIAVNALGYGHPSLEAVLDEASKGLLHVSNLFYHPAQGLLAERLLALTHLSSVFFCNSGTEANEAALKFARLRNPGRSGVVALEESFHGRTMGSLSLTGHDAYRAPFLPLVEGVRFIEPNSVAELEAAVSEETSAIFLEPIMGEAGVIPLSVEFLQAASRLAAQTGALLVCDEVQCGLGRSGAWFGYQESGIEPDIITLAKPLGGGLPLGAVIVGRELQSVVRPGHHGTTFGGNPLACRLGLAVLDTIEQEGLLDKVNSLGAWLGQELENLAAHHSSIVAVRGRGLMWGIELDVEAKPIATELLHRGFVVGTARERVLRLLPPYVITRGALEAFVWELGDILSTAANGQALPMKATA